MPLESKMHGEDEVGSENDWEDFNTISELNIQYWTSVYGQFEDTLIVLVEANTLRSKHLTGKLAKKRSN